MLTLGMSTCSSLLFKNEASTYTPNKIYYDAVYLYNTQQYLDAKNKLDELQGVIPESDPVKPYSIFYSSLCSYQLKQFKEGIFQLSQLVKLYPSWPNICECYYWLGYLNFLVGNASDGVTFLNKINDKKFKNDVYLLKKQFLISNTVTTVNDKAASSIFNDKTNDKQSFINKRNQHLKKLPLELKDKYTVAVLLPFCINKLQPKKKSNYITDLYTGIEVAHDKLISMGIPVDIITYDTNKSPEVVSQILYEKGFKNKVDTIIGPLYQKEIEKVKEFAQKEKINVFNPLSNNSDIINNNDFTFLFQPSIETQALAAARYTENQVIKTDNNIGIIYTSSQEDCLMANTYYNYVSKLENANIALMQCIDEDRVKNILFDFKENVKLKKQGKPYDKLIDDILGLSHIFIASKKDELLVNNMLALLDLIKYKPKIIGSLSWLKFDSLDPSQLNRLGVILISPEYINNKKDSLNEFKLQYIKRFKKIPSYYAYVGYELMMYIGNMLNEGGKYFQKKGIHYDGEIFESVYFGYNQDNQNVVITTLNENYIPEIYRYN